MTQIVVDNQRTDADPRSGQRHRGERSEQARLGANVVTDLDDVKAPLLGRLRQPDHFGWVGARSLEGEPEWPHRGTIPARRDCPVPREHACRLQSLPEARHWAMVQVPPTASPRPLRSRLRSLLGRGQVGPTGAPKR